MSCLPAFTWRRSTKKPACSSGFCTGFAGPDASKADAGKAKVLNAKVWPGDVLPSKEAQIFTPSTRSSFKTSEASSTTATESELSPLPCNKSDGIDSSYTTSCADEDQPEVRTSEIIEQDKEEVEEDDDIEPVNSPSGSSFHSSMKHVEDWVNNLEEPLKDEVSHKWEDEVNEEHGHRASASSVKDEGDTESDLDRELNTLVVKSLNPSAAAANLSGIGLKTIPFLGAFNNLRTLSLSGNSIGKIFPGCLPQSLHFLDLSRNKISRIEGLRGLNRLRVLNLSYNRISRIGHGLGNCTSIRELYLSGNKISEVEGLHRLRKLFLLDLSNNRLTTTKSLAQLAANYSCLQVLNLLGNAVVLNLGEEQLRRFITAIAPHLTYLNRQPIKPVPAREAVVGKFSRTGTADGSSKRYPRKASLSLASSKAKRVESLQQAHRRRNSSKHF